MSDGKSKPLPPAVEGKMVVEKLGETIRNHLAQATAAERKQCLDQLSAWVADREKEDRDKYNARVARGEPAPSAYTPPYTCKPVPANATSSDTKDPTFEHTTQVTQPERCPSPMLSSLPPPQGGT